MLKLLISLILTTNKLPIAHLNSTNHVKIIGNINHDSIDFAISQLNSISNKNFYIYLDTPGGIVDEGERFVSQILYKQATGSQVTCIAENALSMGFYIFQNCNTRLITPSGKLMQHQISLNNNHIPLDNLDNYIKMVRKISRNINQFCANHINISVQEFEKKVNNDWWLYGQDAIDENAADGMTLVGSSPQTVTLTI